MEEEKYAKCKECGHHTFINRVCFRKDKNKTHIVQRGDNLYCEKCKAHYNIYNLEGIEK